MLTEIRFAGFGGQGILLAANIVGKAAAIFHGGHATLTQNYGPEARGGASSAQLVISEEPILYPYTTHEDILVALSQEAFAKFHSGIKPNGLLIVEEELVRVEGLAPAVRVFGIPATRVAEELGKKVVLNVVIVGFLAALGNFLPKQAFVDALSASVPKNLLDLNLRAFDKGYEKGIEAAQKAALEEETTVPEPAWSEP